MKNVAGEVAHSFRGCGNGDQVGVAIAQTGALVIDKEKGVVSLDRAAKNASEAKMFRDVA